MAEISTFTKSNTNQEEIQRIFRMLKSGDENIKLSKEKDIVLILGNTGAGKSTLAHFIAGNNEDLISEEINEDSGEFIIKDLNDKISGNSTILSKTIYPDRIFDAETKTIFYDCPGFIDTRSPAHDITATYFVKKVIDFAGKIKLIFVVNHSSVRKGVDRNDFMLLVHHATNLLKNIDKFKDSIALVVSKVDNTYRKKGTYLVPDESVIASIVEFLKTVQQDIKEISNAPNNSFKKLNYEKALQFIDVLLDFDGEKYRRISLFRRPDERGPISKIKLLQDGKHNLKQMIIKNLVFANKNEDDFGYSVSAQSINYIHDIGEKIHESIAFELARIGEDIKNYFELEERQTRDVYDLYDKFVAGKNLLSVLEMKNINPERGFIKEIIKRIDDMNIEISRHTVLNIVNYLSFLKFLSDVSNKSMTSNSLIWLQGLAGIKIYLTSSQEWYNFLINLHTSLSEYTVQQKIIQYKTEARKLIKQFSVDENSQIKISETDLHLFLDKINIKSLQYNIKNEYGSIKDLTVGHIKLGVLKNILNSTLLNNEVTATCEETDKLVIKGQYVKLSDLNQWEKLCTKKSKFIEVFAVNKVFIDADMNKSGEKLRLSIITPQLEVIGNREILLDGIPGGSQGKASNGWHREENGVDGNPGLPGGPAGCFLGIFGGVSGGQLKISANGGRGGPGQDGGDGADGQRGKDAPHVGSGAVTTIFNQWGPEYERVEYERSYKDEYVLVAYNYYKAKGTIASNGGKGGNGGLRGKGGKKGEVNIVDLSKSGKITVFNNNGPDGMDGIGGKGGSSALNGYTRKADCKSIRYILIVSTNCENVALEYAGRSRPGMPGNTGQNYYRRKDPEDPILYVKPSYTINSFKNYLRSSLQNSVSNSILIKFQEQFESTDNVKQLYDTLGLVNEFQTLESDYLNLEDNMLVFPFYNSLLSRVHKYAVRPKEQERNLEYKKVLNYLYTAALSKLYSTRINTKNYLILDIPEYFNIVVNNIKSLKTLRNDVVINEYKSQYTNEIKKQMSIANDILNTNAIPELKNIIAEMENNIHVLINDTLYSISENEEEKEELYRKKVKLEQSVFFRMMLFPINMVGEFLGFLGPAAGDIIDIISGIGAISESFNLGGQSSDQLDLGNVLMTLSGVLEKAFGSINDAAKERAELLSTQLFDVGSILFKYLGKGQNSDDLNQTYQQVIGLRENLIETTQNDEFVDPDTIEGMRNDAYKRLQDQSNELINSGKADGELGNDLKLVQRLLNISDISPDLYRNIRNDQTQLKVVEDTIKSLDKQTIKLRLFERNIYNIINPKCKQLKMTLNDFNNKQMLNKSHVELDMHKWEIQRTIKDIKFEIEQLTKSFELGEELLHCFDKLIESMSYIINIYDHLDEYNNKMKLAAYLAHLSSSTAVGIKLTNSELENAVKNLEFAIKSNLILEEHNRAMEAFIQYIFPFAELFIGENRLPPSLVFENGTDNLLYSAVHKIERLKSSIEKSTISMNKYDKHIHKNISFSNKRDPLPPFYVWENSLNKNTIQKLLNGAEITIKSDIRKGSPKNAVKFNMIGINLKVDNETIQMNLNKDLEKFEVIMTHLGTSHFKCGNKYYTITSDNPLTFRYHWKKSPDGRSINTNLVYHKIMTSDYILSPYALWSIQLYHENDNFHSLRKYENEIIDLQLEGRGQYIDDDGETEDYVCDKWVDEYYNVDYSEMENMSDIIGDLEPDEYIRTRRDTHYAPAKSGAHSHHKSSVINMFFSVTAGLKVLTYLNPMRYSNQWAKVVSNIHELGSNFLDMSLYSNIILNQEQTTFDSATKKSAPHELVDNSSLSSPSNLLLWDLLFRKFGKKNIFHSSSSLLDTTNDLSQFSHSLAYSHYVPTKNREKPKSIQNEILFSNDFPMKCADINNCITEQISDMRPIISNTNFGYLTENK